MVCVIIYETHSLSLSLHVLVGAEKLLSLGLASSVSSKSGLSELEGSLQGGGRTDLDQLDNSALIRGETSDLLHDLANDSVPTSGMVGLIGVWEHTLA